MSDKIPTAREFLLKEWREVGPMTFNDYEKKMIEFAKLHLQAQTEAILNIADSAGNKPEGSYKKSILNAYPLTNIK